MTCATAIWGRMFSLISVAIGLVSLLLMLPALLPFFGWANWLFVPLALLGALIGQASSGTGARNFCLAVAGFGMLRLWAGGGLI